MLRSVRRALLALLFTGLALGGCQSVWRHPEASEAKYERDTYYCRFGVEPLPPDATEEERRERALTLKQRRGWKNCMTGLGWTTDTGCAAGRPWEERYDRPPPRIVSTPSEPPRAWGLYARRRL